MVDLLKRIEALISLGDALAIKLNNYAAGSDDELTSLIIKTKNENPWFTEQNIVMAVENWINALQRQNVEEWIKPYKSLITEDKFHLNVCVINAGNIPFVGLHDMLTVLICGMTYTGKNATGDSFLLKYVASLLSKIEPGLNEQIFFVDRLEKIDAVIATGSNNSARYFEYYFGKYPHIIRKNRNGAGVLTGNESTDQLHSLGKDIFSYFGLGCRNVSKLYVPVGYDFRIFFESIESFKDIAFHSKYMNNFEYNNSVFLLKQIPFLQNGFLIIREEKNIASPVSVIHYEFYDTEADLENKLLQNLDHLQCIAANKISFKSSDLKTIMIPFGQTQSPQLWNYADGIDTVKFLSALN